VLGKYIDVVFIHDLKDLWKVFRDESIQHFHVFLNVGDVGKQVFHVVAEHEGHDHPVGVFLFEK
jgi:hypothetical protein